MDCSLPCSSAHGIPQARVLEWGAIAFSSYRATFTLSWFVVLISILKIWNFNNLYVPILNIKTSIHLLSQLCLRDQSLWKKVKVAQLCSILWDSMDYVVHGILQARILEEVAFFFSPGDLPNPETQVSGIEGRFFTSRTTREAQQYWSG